MITPYLRRRASFESPVYVHPDVRPALRETFGVIVYHEQVMRTLSAIAGWDLTYADHVRRHLDHEDLVPGFREEFLRRAGERSVERAAAERTWDAVAQFASFGFCKAHAAAFAVPTYQSAWLKANHPAAFYAGILTHEPGMYPRRALLDDARHHGIPIFPLDVNVSAKPYTVEGDGIRIGLMHVEGISDAEVASIIDGRSFGGLVDFCRRTTVSRPVVENLIHAGAMDAFGGRRDLLLQISDLWDRRQPKPEPTQQAITLTEPMTSWGLRPYNDAEKVRAEIEVTGMDVSRHIVTFYGSVLEALGATPSAELRRHRQGTRVMIAGVKVASQTPAVRSGQRIIFVTLDDGTGLSDATVFESVQEQCAFPVFHSWLLVIRGTVRKTGGGRGGVSINAERAWDLAALARDHREGRLDVEDLWTEGVEQIEEAERERVRRRREERRGGPVPTEINPMVPIGEREPRYRPRSGEPEDMPGPTAPAKRLEPVRAPRETHDRPAADAPRKLWHASGGSAGA
jgi:error-prone DNA polymerase